MRELLITHCATCGKPFERPFKLPRFEAFARFGLCDACMKEEEAMFDIEDVEKLLTGLRTIRARLQPVLEELAAAEHMLVSQLTIARNRPRQVAELPAAEPQAAKVCVWKEVVGTSFWRIDCQPAFCSHLNLRAYEFRVCPNCRLPIKVVPLGEGEKHDKISVGDDVVYDDHCRHVEKLSPGTRP